MWTLTRMSDGSEGGAPQITPAERASMRDAMVRQLVSETVRSALEDGARAAPDPIEYLRTAAMEVERVIAMLEAAGPRDGAALRAILAEEIVATAHALIARRQN